MENQEWEEKNNLMALGQLPCHAKPMLCLAWAVRVHVKPFVLWIWFGGLLTGFGGLLAALDRRYRVKVKSRVREALGLSGAAV